MTPPTGGAVPKARSLSSALKASLPGNTHVVCQKNSPYRDELNVP